MFARHFIFMDIFTELRIVSSCFTAYNEEDDLPISIDWGVLIAEQAVILYLAPH